MKPITTTALALVMAAAATPAAAQYGSSPPPQQPQLQPQTQEPAQAQQQNKIQPSKKALKALIDLQTAVKNNDVANIPAKLAAAQAVAETKEDRYLTARLQLQAAATAKNNAAIASAIDAIAASNYLDSKQLSDLYVGLAGSFESAFSIMAFSEAGVFGLMAARSGTGSLTCIIMTDMELSPSNGGRPPTISNSVTPSE